MFPLVFKASDLFISFMNVLNSFFLSSLLRTTGLAFYCFVEPAPYPGAKAFRGVVSLMPF
jgi:hypothetical protein